MKIITLLFVVLFLISCNEKHQTKEVEEYKYNKFKKNKDPKIGEYIYKKKRYC